MPLFHLPVFWFGYFDGFKTLSKLIGIFYNLIRGQVNYTVADGNFRRALEEAATISEQEMYVFPSNVNNYIDIARSAEQGMMSKEKNDFAEFSKDVMSRIDQLERQNNDN